MRTALRLVLPAMLWVLRFSIQEIQSGPEALLLVALDATLLGLHWWAVQPLRAAEPVRFGRNDSATKFLLAPLLLAAFLLVRDAWATLSG